MTVSQLIDELKNINQDTECVCWHSESNSFRPIEMIEMQSIPESGFYAWDDRDDNKKEVYWIH